MFQVTVRVLHKVPTIVVNVVLLYVATFQVRYIQSVNCKDNNPTEVITVVRKILEDSKNGSEVVSFTIQDETEAVSTRLGAVWRSHLTATATTHVVAFYAAGSI